MASYIDLSDETLSGLINEITRDFPKYDQDQKEVKKEKKKEKEEEEEEEYEVEEDSDATVVVTVEGISTPSVGSISESLYALYLKEERDLEAELISTEDEDEEEGREEEEEEESDCNSFDTLSTASTLPFPSSPLIARAFSYSSPPHLSRSYQSDDLERVQVFEKPSLLSNSDTSVLSLSSSSPFIFPFFITHLPCAAISSLVPHVAAPLSNPPSFDFFSPTSSY